jgi:hypothetical protein
MATETGLPPEQKRELEKALIQGIPDDLPLADAQYWLRHKRELNRALAGILRRTSAANPYENERVQQAWFYPDGWAMPNIDRQLERVAGVFGDSGVSEVSVRASQLMPLPKGADGVALIPKISYLGKRWGLGDPYGRDYGGIVEQVLALIAAHRPFQNWHERDLGPSHRIHANVKELLMRLEAESPGDVLVFPTSFGNLYAGYSPRHARWQSLHQNQLPLGAAQVGCLLLTMPDRLSDWQQLFIDAPADEYNWRLGGRWSFTPFFYYHGMLKFREHEADLPHSYFGSAVAFLSLLA